MTHERILIAEDEGITALDLERTVRAFGYQPCGVAATGEEAVTLAEEYRPDLVLMDIRLAGDLDGIDAGRRIRAAHDVPIVYLTAHADDETHVRARTTAPYGFVVKPFDELQLKSTLATALWRHAVDLGVQDYARQLEESVAERTHRLEANVRALLATGATLSTMRGELERARGAAHRFARSLSHLMASPLNVVVGMAGILARDAEVPAARQRQLAAAIIVAARRLARMVEDLRDFGALTFDSLAVVPAPTDLAITLLAAAEPLVEWAERRQVRLRVSVDAVAGTAVAADASRLARAVARLLDHAISSTGPGGVASLEAALAPDGGEVEIAVADSGDPLSPEEARLLLDLNAPLAADDADSDVGLAFARRVVELHGATLRLESNPAGGNSFRFRLRAVA